MPIPISHETKIIPHEISIDSPRLSSSFIVKGQYQGDVFWGFSSAVLGCSRLIPLLDGTFDCWGAFPHLIVKTKNPVTIMVLAKL